MPSTKPRLNVYFEAAMLRRVGELAARRRCTKSAVVEAAVASFLSGDSAERQEAALSRRLDRIMRALDRLERDQRIATEALALFVRHWLTAVPPVPQSGLAAARAAGRQRYGEFVQAVARELAKGGGMAEEVERELGAPGDEAKD
jgi:hypothetical protein